MDRRYYQSSNKFSAAGLLLVMLSTAVVGTMLSIPYLFLIRVCPSAKLCVVITALYGIVLGVISAGLCKAFKIRNVGLAVLGVCIGVLIYTYFKWGFFVSYTYTSWFPEYFEKASYFTLTPDMLKSPSDFWASIVDINSFGTWTLGRYSQNNVTGIFLWIAWGGEIIMLAVMTILITVDRVKKPFIEDDNDWAKEYKNDGFNFEYFDVLQNKQEIEENPNYLLKMKPLTVYNSKEDFINIKVYHSVDFMECYIVLTEMKYQKKNKKYKITPVMNYLRVGNGFFNTLYSMFSNDFHAYNNSTESINQTVS